MTVAAILLAGGESSRMGRPKPLLEWGPSTLRLRSGQASLRTGGQTLIEYQVAQLKEAGVERIVVVLGHGADEVRPFVHRAGAQAVINELYSEGRASSLRVGAAALPDETDTIVVLNVDQPRPRWVTAALLREHRDGGNVITLPVFGGRRGHPAILHASLLPEVRNVREATQGLREVIERHEERVVEVAFETDVVVLGMNTPEEYEQARASYFEQVPS